MSLDVLRHSTSHVMAHAVKKLFPSAKLSIGPAISDGFYYDFSMEKTLSLQDLEKIEEEMQKIIEDNLPFVKKEVNKEEAIKLFKEKGENYKVEILKEISDEKVTLYEQGDFIDLCKGPHLQSTSQIKFFKLLKISGAYFKGDEKREMLQRIYGTAFFTQEELTDYLNRLKEAEKRDHRNLGRELELFNFYEEAGPGLVFWHPKGAKIRRIIEDFWIKEHEKRGYQLVYTPHIAKIALWKTSGHLEFYKENMYSPMDVEGQNYIVKPMNCPAHILIYKSKMRSYRELPLRFAEFGTVYRYERSGVLHGLLRVRGFTQDDAHIFCTEEQLEDEMMNCVELAFFILKTFGFEEYKVDLATRPEKFAGTKEEWNLAEDTLKKALNKKNISYNIDSGGAVFYGPKIDIKIEDALGRLWQGPTIQFDFNLSKRFNVNFIGADSKEHSTFMIHRALFGSMERFFGCLIEHYSGWFPVWLAPVQIIILPIAERHNDFANELQKRFQDKNLRVEVDTSSKKLQFKIRESILAKIPYILIVGDKEVQEKTVSVRKKEKDFGLLQIDKFEEIILKEINSRS